MVTCSGFFYLTAEFAETAEVMMKIKATKTLMLIRLAD
jgi:hypothetical protein